MKTRSILLVFAALVFGTYPPGFGGTNVTINLGTATDFALLAGSGITNASPATIITGDVGSSPTPSVTGLLASQVNGTLYLTASPVTAQAQTDLTVGYNQAAGAPCSTDLTGTDLGGLTLVPGVYCFSSSAQLTGRLTLDAQGNANSQWVFQIGSTLTTATNSSVSLINGAVQCNVFWQVGSSATIQTNTVFVGNILALTSITLDGGTLNGKALALNGAVTISTQETVDGPACTCTVFVSSSTAGNVTSITFAEPYQWSGATKTVIASGLASAKGLVCGSDRRLYLSQSGASGGTRQIVRLDQSGANLHVVVDFAAWPQLASSGGPMGLRFGTNPPQLFFTTTDSVGFSNTGVWSMASSPVQVMDPLPHNGRSNGAGGAAFLTSGPFAGDLLTVDVANNDVVRISPPFNSAQPGIDFITNLPGPQGVTVNAAGNVFVSNTDGSIDQFANDGTSLGLFVTTDLHNMNITVGSSRNSFLVTTQEGPIVLVLANGTHTIIGSVTGGDGVTVCPQ
jgi:hypothetical protein